MIKTPEVLLVTGGGRGIGAAICRLAGASGHYKVCVNYANDAHAAEQVVADIKAAGGQAMALQGDVASQEDIKRLFATIDAQWGPLGALVNNAGIVAGRQTLLTLDIATLKRVLDVNVVGTFLCTQEALRRMIPQKRGAIVNLSSQAARFGGFHLSHYAASKAAIEAFTLGVAREVAAEGIRINAVSPSIIDTQGYVVKTGSIANNTDLPMGRKGTPREVAEAVLWLLSDKASYVTGSVLPISGGR